MVPDSTKTVYLGRKSLKEQAALPRDLTAGVSAEESLIGDAAAAAFVATFSEGAGATFEISHRGGEAAVSGDLDSHLVAGAIKDGRRTGSLPAVAAGTGPRKGTGRCTGGG